MRVHLLLDATVDTILAAVQSTDRQCIQCKSAYHLQYNNHASEEQGFLNLHYL